MELATTGRAVGEAQEAILTQTTPTEAVKSRKGRGGRDFKYVTHAWVTRTLNEAFGWAWSFEVDSYELIPRDDPSQVFVKGRLTVYGKEGQTLVKEQFGSAEVKHFGSDHKRTGQPLSIGDDLKAAASDALKKCASLLGLALDLYDPPKPSKKMSDKFHALGKELYGEAWDSKHAELVRAITGGQYRSSKHLTAAQMSELIDGMENKKRNTNGQ